MVRLTAGLRSAGKLARVFKSRWFSREARSLGITDAELLRMAGRVYLGQGDDLGGGVWKQRVDGNRHRAIVLARGARHFFFVYAFAKNERDNIRCDELLEFKRLAGIYARYETRDIEALLATGVLIEVEKQ